MICSLFSVFLQKFSTKCSALALLDAWMLAIYAMVPRLLPTHCSLIRVHSRHNWKTTHAERWTQVAGPNHKITNRQCCYARSPPLLFEETTNKVNWSLCSQWLTGNMATSSKQQNVERKFLVRFFSSLFVLWKQSSRDDAWWPIYGHTQHSTHIHRWMLDEASIKSDAIEWKLTSVYMQYTLTIDART